jgi:hypothetical protein
VADHDEQWHGRLLAHGRTDHEPTPVLETLITSLDELTVVVGPRAAAPTRRGARWADAGARSEERGDVPAATQAIAAAMRELVEIAAASIRLSRV